MEPLLDTAPFGFLVVRDDGYVEVANRAIVEILETTHERVVASHIDRFLSVPSRIFYQSHVFPTLKLQGQVHEVYLTLMTAGESEVPVLLNASRRQAADGHRSDWALVAMRQRNEYENEILEARRLAEAAGRAKDDFLSLVSHELRSPLSAIKNWASLIARGDLAPAVVKRGMEAIERNANLQVKLVDDLLDHARLATGKLHVELSRVDVRPVLENVLSSMEPTASARSIVLERDLEPGPLRAMADPERLQQVFWNILSNAIKFTPAQGRVRVAMRCSDGWIEIAVTDTGKGIAPEFLPHVFESFRQEEGRVTRAEGGLGLGMSISRQLVELHGGSIAAESEGPDKGSTFTLRLPAVEMEDCGRAMQA